MAAFVISFYDIINPDLYNEYLQKAIPTLVKHKAEILVADNAAITLEGKPCQLHAVMKFSTETEALNWYKDPEYQAIIPIRKKATANGSMVITDEYSLAH